MKIFCMVDPNLQLTPDMSGQGLTRIADELTMQKLLDASHSEALLSSLASRDFEVRVSMAPALAFGRASPSTQRTHTGACGRDANTAGGAEWPHATHPVCGGGGVAAGCVCGHGHVPARGRYLELGRHDFHDGHDHQLHALDHTREEGGRRALGMHERTVVRVQARQVLCWPVRPRRPGKEATRC